MNLVNECATPFISLLTPLKEQEMKELYDKEILLIMPAIFS